MSGIIKYYRLNISFVLYKYKSYVCSVSVCNLAYGNGILHGAICKYNWGTPLAASRLLSGSSGRGPSIDLSSKIKGTLGTLRAWPQRNVCIRMFFKKRQTDILYIKI